MVVGGRYVFPNDLIVSHLVADTRKIKGGVTAGVNS